MLTALGLCASAFGGHLDLKAFKLGNGHFCRFVKKLEAQRERLDGLIFWIILFFEEELLSLGKLVVVRKVLQKEMDSKVWWWRWGSSQERGIEGFFVLRGGKGERQSKLPGRMVVDGAKRRGVGLV